LRPCKKLDVTQSYIPKKGLQQQVKQTLDQGTCFETLKKTEIHDQVAWNTTSSVEAYSTIAFHVNRNKI